MGDVIERRRKFENDLRAEVEQAQDTYQRLSRECIRLTRDMCDAPGADGTLAHAQVAALQRQCNAALNVWDIVLRRFTSVVVYRQFPKELDPD